MFTPVYDAVRVARSEIESAGPCAPVVVELHATGPVVSMRRGLALRLHALAESIAPRQEIAEPAYATECAAC